jgi:hypothetical protein
VRSGADDGAATAMTVDKGMLIKAADVRGI